MKTRTSAKTDFNQASHVRRSVSHSRVEIPVYLLPTFKKNINYLLNSYIDRDFLMNTYRNNKAVQIPNL